MEEEGVDFFTGCCRVMLIQTNVISIAGTKILFFIAINLQDFSKTAEIDGNIFMSGNEEEIKKNLSQMKTPVQ